MKSYIVKEREDGTRYFDENTPAGNINPDVVGNGLEYSEGKLSVDAAELAGDGLTEDNGKLKVDSASIDNVVHLDGAESITGAKTFTTSPQVPTVGDSSDSTTKAASTAFVQGVVAEAGTGFLSKTESDASTGQISMSRALWVRNDEFTKGSVPSAGRVSEVLFTDKNGKTGASQADVLLGNVGTSISSDGNTTETHIRAIQNTSGSSVTAEICVAVDKNGAVSTTAPTPSVDSSTRDIATTEWANNLANNLVHKDGTENITGAKTFTADISCKKTTPWVFLKTNEVKGTAPSGSRGCGILLSEPNNVGAVNRFADVALNVNADKSTHAAVRAFKNEAGSSTYATLGITYPATGDPYTTAPVPPVDDSSSKIATTSFVRALLKSLKVKTPIEAAKNFYVNGTTGSDTLDEGRGETSGKPFKTIQACVNYVTQYFSLGANNVKIVIAGGVYNERLYLGMYDSSTGRIALESQSAASRAIVRTTYNSDADSFIVRAVDGGSYTLSGIDFEFVNARSAANTAYRTLGLIWVSSRGSIQLLNSCSVKYTRTGSVTANTGINVFFGQSYGDVQAQGNITVTIEDSVIPVNIISAGTHSQCTLYSTTTAGAVFTLNSARCSNFAVASNASINVSRIQGTYTINVPSGFIGKKYSITNGGNVNTGTNDVNWLPGSVAGTVEASTYSWYK